MTGAGENGPSNNTQTRTATTEDDDIVNDEQRPSTSTQTGHPMTVNDERQASTSTHDEKVATPAGDTQHSSADVEQDMSADNTPQERLREADVVSKFH